MPTILRAEPADAEAILALQKLAYEREAELYNDWSIPPLTQTLQALLAEFDDHVILKAIDEQTLVGSVRARLCAETCAIGRLVVHPAWQRQGLGTSLLRQIEACFPAASRFELFTGSRSEGNIRLYRRQGYAVTHTKSLSPNVDVVFLQKIQMDAESTHQVFDWLWTSGQLSERDIATLPALGIEAVINLALPTSMNALPGEAESVTSHGIVYVQIPVEWEAPTIGQLTTFFKVVGALAGKKIWIHCAKNMRVSAFIYLYRRLCLSEPEEVARHPLAEVWTPNETWQAFIAQALLACKPVDAAI